MYCDYQKLNLSVFFAIFEVYCGYICKAYVFKVAFSALQHRLETSGVNEFVKASISESAFLKCRLERNSQDFGICCILQFKFYIRDKFANWNYLNVHPFTHQQIHVFSGQTSPCRISTIFYYSKGVIRDMNILYYYIQLYEENNVCPVLHLHVCVCIL